MSSQSQNDQFMLKLTDAGEAAISGAGEKGQINGPLFESAIYGHIDPEDMAITTARVCITTPAWRRFHDVMVEMANSRNPSTSLLEELARCRNAVFDEIAPIIAVDKLRRAFNTEQSNQLRVFGGRGVG